MDGNILDLAVVRLASAWVDVERDRDLFFLILSGCTLLKGAVPLALLWYLWFGTAGDLDPARAARPKIATTFLATVMAIGVCRILTNLLPFRLRPLHEESLDYPLAFGMGQSTFSNMSSMPSDHAAMFFALAAGIFFISRGFGALAFLHALTFVMVPRIYLGLHYFTDILVGGAVGMAVTWICFRAPVVDRVGRLCSFIYGKNPALFYMLMFLASLELATICESLQRIVNYIKFDIAN